MAFGVSIGSIGGEIGSRTTRAENCRPKIRFVGVWDTVAAYGGPITEITRAIDNWFFPLSMPDYHLNETCAARVTPSRSTTSATRFIRCCGTRCTRSSWSTTKQGHTGDRLEQVWFTGMHADVGGGYPDESLSYVSLLWMMEEAEQPGCAR